VKYLLAPANWRKVAKKISRAPLVILYLDYDGTLTPIRKHPRLARLSAQTKKILRSLSQSKRVKICIISGRSLAEIKKMVGLKNLTYVGNHGLEIEWDGRLVTLPGAGRIKIRLEQTCRRLTPLSRKYTGFWVENKGLTASMHYRLVNRKRIRSLEKEVRQQLKKHLTGFRLTSGKKVWEIRPRTNRDKGWAVRFLSGKFRAKEKLQIYIGDDTTDLDAMKVVNRTGGISVFVGNLERESNSFYNINSPEEVRLFLQRITGVVRK
jgi:trehalose-phosphatase